MWLPCHSCCGPSDACWETWAAAETPAHTAFSWDGRSLLDPYWLSEMATCHMKISKVPSRHEKKDGACRKIPSLSGFHCGYVISWPSGHRALHLVPVELSVAPPPQDSGRWALLVGCTTYCHTAGSSCKGRRRKMGIGRTITQVPRLKKIIKVLHSFVEK